MLTSYILISILLILLYLASERQRCRKLNISNKSIDITLCPVTDVTVSSKRPVLPGTVSRSSNIPKSISSINRFIVKYKGKDMYLSSFHQGNSKMLHSINTAILDVSDVNTKILTHPSIELVEYDFKVTACAQGTQSIGWFIRSIGADQSFTKSGDGEGSVDADCYILDTGASTSHSDLNIVEAKSFIDYESSTDDMNGHSTHCCGIIGAKDNDIGIVGIAPGTRLHCMKVLDKNGSGTVSAILSALNYVSKVNPGKTKVLNMSFCSYTGKGKYGVLEHAVDICIKEHLMLCVIAAGNEHDDASYYTPSKVNSAITVGAYDSTNILASFSNYGPSVDIYAPGVSIYSTYLNNGFTMMSGSSMATPAVVGAAVLIISKEPYLKPIDIKDRILSLAKKDIIITNNTSNTTSLYIANI